MGSNWELKQWSETHFIDIAIQREKSFLEKSDQKKSLLSSLNTPDHPVIRRSRVQASHGRSEHWIELELPFLASNEQTSNLIRLSLDLLNY